ncbi:maleylpyruvate isomerase family mycothiol-dependent enzyme [Gandjariella thermophila]|uniref:Mycothiol-dependent maleylpyruvate isomerase metal-binding domain-containing protein n=1 Tax=Gandjariella thermophila TaxID=1931992 RepID=A0A4D4IYM6_9PSEU|nr:maleylpyruvate isomerase family mycothiol-dependent enzyme [Gandjariella thermophila]GDY29495.1 hypothetical protein GTS_11280 [Gandjariella thermophila]
MEYAVFVEQIRVQSEALRAAAVKVGPDARVPTCPEWTVKDLVAHIARVHVLAAAGVRTAPDAERPSPAPGPEDWDELLAWWADRERELTDLLDATDPDAPAWVFATTVPRVAGFWARRQAHETAIHRLDAEHALAGSAAPSAVPTLVFTPEFAADGIDEFLVMQRVMGERRGWSQHDGRLLIHAADAGRAWHVVLRPGQPIEVGPAVGSGTQEDATIAGTADAVYRALWGRPSSAIVTGRKELLDAIAAP